MDAALVDPDRGEDEDESGEERAEREAPERCESCHWPPTRPGSAVRSAGEAHDSRALGIDTFR
jgi:hypothetical protein